MVKIGAGNMKQVFKASQSKINTGRKCLQAYKYKYVNKLRRIAKARPLQFGGIMHDLFEAHAEGKDPFKKLEEIGSHNRRLFREEREMYGNIVVDAKYIMAGYLDYYKSDPIQYQARQGKRSEHEFKIGIADDIEVTGKVDGVGKAKKMLWLIEHKNHKSFPNGDHRWRNVQSSIYIRFVEELGWWQLDGTLWDYIRSKPPTRPQLLKNGKLSERELDSLPQVVIDTIKEHGLDPKKYKGLIDTQRQRMSTWYERVYTPNKKEVVDSIVRDFILSAKILRDTNFEKRVPRSIGKHCDWCEFEPLCRAALTGADEDYVMEREYEVKERTEREEEAERERE